VSLEVTAILQKALWIQKGELLLAPKHISEYRAEKRANVWGDRKRRDSSPLKHRNDERNFLGKRASHRE